MVASHDRHAFCYKIGCPSPNTTIANFRSNFIENLKCFREKNGRLPMKFIYFRHDESGSRSLEKIMTSERNAMIQACREVDEGHEKIVQITMIIVERERQMRLFASGKNVPPGTIIDTFITHHQHHQFYMVSQQAIEGVTRPTKYRIFLDEGNHCIDDLQELVYFVSVSINFCCSFKFKF